MHEELREALTDARWQAGPLYIDPWIGIRELTWVDNVFAANGDEVSDFTTTVGAGLRFFVPVGNSTVLAASALPEYNWWADLEERRRLNGRYAAGLFTETNRLTLELEGRLEETQTIVTPQIEQRINQRLEQIRGDVEFRLYRSLRLFAEGSNSTFENLLDELPRELVPQFTALDRDEDVLRAGLRFSIYDRLHLGFGVEDSEVTFADRAFDVSNSGTAPVFELEFDNEQFLFLLDLAWRDLEPLAGSDFVPYDDMTGSATLTIDVNDDFRLSGYGRRNLIYAIGSQFAYFGDDTLGVSIGRRVKERMRVRLFAETADHDYVPRPGFEDERQDDVTQIGAAFSFDWSDALTFVLQGGVTDVDSSIDFFDRETTFVSLSLSFNELAWP
ncbi:MAG: hypothetical protein AAGK22_15995 [Acidobacteriota bacterium]